MSARSSSSVPAAAARAAVAAEREPEHPLPLPLPLEEAILFFLCSVRQEPPFLARKKTEQLSAS
jgi:hypothetical protein